MSKDNQKDLITVLSCEGYTDAKNPYDAKAYDSIIASCLSRWVGDKGDYLNGQRVKVQAYIYVIREGV